MGSQYGYSNSTVTIKYVPGQSVGDIYGTPYTRYGDTKNPIYSDKNLPLLIGADGFPVLTPFSTQKVLGNSYPKWMGSIGNTFSYKNWSLYLLWDTRQGLEKYDQFSNFMAAFGIAKITENRDQTTVFNGVLADGTPNTKPVYLGQGVGPDGVNYGAGYYRNRYRGIAENFVEDASWVRLRTATLSYTFPAQLLPKSFIKNLGLGVTGNNLLLFTKYKGFDPESSSTAAGSNANGFCRLYLPCFAQHYFLTKRWFLKQSTMKKTLVYILLSLCMLTAVSSCKKYLDINQNPNAAEEPPINGLLANTTYNTAYDVYSASNYTSYYVQYLASPSTASDVDVYNTINPSTTWYRFYNIMTDLYDMKRFWCRNGV